MHLRHQTLLPRFFSAGIMRRYSASPSVWKFWTQRGGQFCWGWVPQSKVSGPKNRNVVVSFATDMRKNITQCIDGDNVIMSFWALLSLSTFHVGQDLNHDTLINVSILLQTVSGYMFRPTGGHWWKTLHFSNVLSQPEGLDMNTLKSFFKGLNPKLQQEAESRQGSTLYINVSSFTSLSIAWFRQILQDEPCVGPSGHCDRGTFY